jgi:hypothetical protein
MNFFLLHTHQGNCTFSYKHWKNDIVLCTFGIVSVGLSIRLSQQCTYWCGCIWEGVTSHSLYTQLCSLHLENYSQDSTELSQIDPVHMFLLRMEKFHFPQISENIVLKNKAMINERKKKINLAKVLNLKCIFPILKWIA